MDEEALQFGNLADLERLSSLMDSASEMILQLTRELHHVSFVNETTKKRRNYLSYVIFLFSFSKY